MTLVFWFLVVLGLCLIWLLCSFLYRPIGKLFSRLVNDAKQEMFETNKKEKEKQK
jgi:hypothetical protein